jgi:hypothetical protein
MSIRIPAHLHFIWIGQQLPWFAKLAIQSAMQRVPQAQVTLWASHDLEADAHVGALRAESRFDVRMLNDEALFAGAPSTLPVELLAHLFASLPQPAARANLARLLVLARFGGVYLDTDTLTLRDLEPLYALGAFCGLEHVVWPFEAKRGIHPYRLFGGPLRSLVRSVCVAAPHGERVFERVAGFYRTAANNAVLGFSAGHPFLLEALKKIATLSASERQTRFRLGTHLLQEMLAQRGDALGVHQLPARYFYPLGPEISRHYLRPRQDAREAARRIVHTDTHVIHWYASVSELAHYDEARVLSERGQSVFAQLASDVLTER